MMRSVLDDTLQFNKKIHKKTTKNEFSVVLNKQISKVYDLKLILEIGSKISASFVNTPCGSI